jgi:hypothetical protein
MMQSIVSWQLPNRPTQRVNPTRISGIPAWHIS